jgi:nucleotide-binding universal stress UspA family protein
VIVDHASETGADFIVLGAHEEITKRRFLLGSVAKTVLRAAHCSVQVLRAPNDEEQASRPPRILLATDGSDGALLAAKSIANRPLPAGTEVHILSAIEPYTSLFHVVFPPGAEEALRAQAVDRAQEAIRKAKEILTGVGLSISEKTSLLATEPDAIILVEAGRWNADLIVVGSHGRRGLNRLFLGSVSEAVAFHAACSVEIIRNTPVRCKGGYSAPVEEHVGVPALARC